MVETVIIKELRCGDSVFHSGDKVRLIMKKSYKGNDPGRRDRYVGFINNIYDDRISMRYNHEPSYFTRDIPEEDRPCNDLGMFRTEDIASVERL